MIWFDLDNSPHVPLFAPVFKELTKRSISYDVTARDFAQTLDLLKMWNIPHTAIGSHGGKNKIKKVLNLLKRKGELKKYINTKYAGIAKPKISVSHGSRTQLVASKALGIHISRMRISESLLMLMTPVYWRLYAHPVCLATIMITEVKNY